MPAPRLGASWQGLKLWVSLGASLWPAAPPLRLGRVGAEGVRSGAARLGWDSQCPVCLPAGPPESDEVEGGVLFLFWFFSGHFYSVMRRI